MPINMKAVIAETFVELMKHKNIDRITVRDVVEACGVSRQTFYYHFRDITEVIEYLVQQALRDMLRESLKANTLREALSVFIAAAVSSERLLRKMMHSQRREQIEILLVHSARTYLGELLRAKAPELEVPLTDVDLALNFCAYGIAGTLLEHFEKHDLDQEKLAEQMARLLSGKMIDFSE